MSATQKTAGSGFRAEAARAQAQSPAEPWIGFRSSPADVIDPSVLSQKLLAMFPRS